MLRRLEWDAQALLEFEHSIAWYAERNQTAARRMAEAVSQTALSLVAPEFPASGRLGLVAGTRELVVGQRTPYILTFINDGEICRIIRCRHERREYP